jgi:hypothetical protein
MNVVSRVLAVIGVVTLSATAAHAGHGQGGGGQTVQGYECYLVSGGDNEQAIVDLNGNADPTTEFADQTNVGIAKGGMICVQVTVTLVSRPNLVVPPGQAPSFNTLPLSNALVLKCYSMQQITASNPGVVVKVTDGLDIEMLGPHNPQTLCLQGVITP